jgi:3-phosphoshikimate 1-carboxyvinyltransferase
MKLVQPANFIGQVSAPASKSMMQRYVALAAIASSATTIKNPSLCDDGLASLEVARGLGAMARTRKDGNIEIIPDDPVFPCVLKCAESGTSFRIFSAIAGLYEKPITLTGTGSLLSRTMQMVVDTLSRAGLSVSSNGGFAPLTITGPFKENIITIDGSITSQLISGLLIALPRRTENTKLIIKNLKSRPYIEMTLKALKNFLVNIEYNKDFSEFDIPGNQQPTGQILTVEGDWSSASFLLVAAVTTGSIVLSQISKDSLQADKAILDVIESTGGKIEWINKNTLRLEKPQSPLMPFEFDATDCPDLFPPLVSLATACDGVSIIRGTSRLIHKESNRAEALIKEFRKFGISITHQDDSLKITGGTLSQPDVPMDSYNDHRIVMATAITALRALKLVAINDSDVVKKSYPDFFEVLEKNSKISE